MAIQIAKDFVIYCGLEPVEGQSSAHPRHSRSGKAEQEEAGRDSQGILEEMEVDGLSSTTMEVFGTGPPSTDYTFDRGKAAAVYRGSAGQRLFPPGATRIAVMVWFWKDDWIFPLRILKSRV